MPSWIPCVLWKRRGEDRVDLGYREQGGAVVRAGVVGVVRDLKVGRHEPDEAQDEGEVRLLVMASSASWVRSRMLCLALEAPRFHEAPQDSEAMGRAGAREC